MDAKLKHRIISLGFSALAVTRADEWLSPLARGRGAILMFHHVRPARDDPFQPNALLEVTPGHLDRLLGLVRDLGFAIVPLDEVPDRLADRRGDAGRFVALTFDDGYRDNRDHALPILKRHAAPWTMFVTSDYASGRGRLWWLELEEVVRRLDRIEVAMDGRTTVLPSRTAAEKKAAFAAAYRDLRQGPEERLRGTIAGWCEIAGLDGYRLVRDLCLDWDELAALSHEPGVTIGAHTVSHPMLAKHDAETARREIHDGRTEIETRLGLTVRHLAFPVGDPTSAGPREFALARDAGYRTAVTTRPGHLFPGHAAHLTALPRVSINGLHQTEAASRALMSGAPFLLWNRGRRIDVR